MVPGIQSTGNSAKYFCKKQNKRLEKQNKLGNGVPNYKIAKF